MKKLLLIAVLILGLSGSFSYGQTVTHTIYIDGTPYIPMTPNNQTLLGIALLPSKEDANLNVQVSHGIESDSKRSVLTSDLRLPFLLSVTIEDKPYIPSEHPFYYQSGILYLPYTTQFRTLLEDNGNAFKSFDPLHPDRDLRPYETTYNTFDDLPIDTFVRNQGSANTCWAHAANTAFEISIFKNQGQTPTFSVPHMIENAPIPSTAYSGGNFNTASTYYLNQTGPVTEMDQKKTYHLTGYHTLTGVSAIKSHVKNYGAVITGIYFDPVTQAYYKPSDTAYFNPSTNNPITHDILIVGWDDNFPKSSFTHTPSRNGAYIALNSFGANWGENGIFYISYEDVHASTQAYALTDIQNTNTEETVQYHNDKGLTHFESYQSQKSAFGSVKYTNPKSTQQWLTAVGVYIGAPNTHVALYASEFPATEDTFDHVNLLAEHVFRTPGYFRIPLNQAVKIKGNQPYFVHALYTSDTTYQIPIQASYPGIYYELNSKMGNGYIGSLNPQFSIVDISLYRELGSVALRAYLETTP